MKIYTYEEYLRINNITDKERFEECENCGGTGECNRCECEQQHDCGYCYGKGKIDTEREEYERKKIEQQKKYEEWQETFG